MRQRRADLRDAFLERVRDLKRVLRLLHDHDAAHDLALAVQVGDPAPLVVADLDVADVLELDRPAVPAMTDDQRLQVVDVVVIHDAADLVVAIRDLDRAPAGFLERASQRVDELPQRNAGVREQRREHLELILLLQSADGRDFGDAGQRLQRGLDLIVVEQPQLARIAELLLVDQRVLVDPTDAACVRADAHGGVGRQLLANRVEPLRNGRAHGVTPRRAAQDHIDE